MTLYLDTSAMLKLYVQEPESEACELLLASDLHWTRGRHTLVEARRNLARLLDGEAHTEAVAQFSQDWNRVHVVELSAQLCEVAVSIAEETGARSLDALHVAAALQTGEPTMVTYDTRLAEASNASGLVVAQPG